MGNNDFMIRLLQERGNLVESPGGDYRLNGILIGSGLVRASLDVPLELGVFDPDALGGAVVSGLVIRHVGMLDEGKTVGLTLARKTEKRSSMDGKNSEIGSGGRLPVVQFRQVADPMFLIT
jgi:hypothetical protein